MIYFLFISNGFKKAISGKPEGRRAFATIKRNDKAYDRTEIRLLWDPLPE
jgi:hypothetical protein